MDPVTPSSGTRLVVIFSITTHLAEPLKHTLLVKLSVDTAHSCFVLLERDTKPVGDISLPSLINLWNDSVLSIEIQEKHRLLKNKNLAELDLSLADIWPTREKGEPKGHTKKFQVPLCNSEIQIWLNLFTMPSKELVELEMHLGGTIEVNGRADECMEGTRIDILSDVQNKINDLEEKNIVWIYGSPGSGKSSVSLTIKSQLEREGRPVTYFRFDRNDTALTTSSVLWRRVVYDLADIHSSVRANILALLRRDKVDLRSTMELFEFLVKEPLSQLNDPSSNHPLITIIDALDECGGLEGRSSSDRAALLQTLKSWSQLPRHFKLIVTSRREDDIVEVLSPISTPIGIPSGQFLDENPQAEASVHASNDIRTFLEERFRNLRTRHQSLPADWPGPETTSDMVCRAAGIFMWATTAANVIGSSGLPGDGLRSIMGNASSTMEPLYSLYTTILELSFGDIDSAGLEAEVLRSVLGIMVLAKRPLKDIEYTKLPTPSPVTIAMLDSIRRGLRSVIAPDDLRFIHRSFDDFLLSEECPPKYAIKKDEVQYLLANLCLSTMTRELRINMCNLNTSCLKNGDFTDIGIRVRDGISPLLSYSCRFWAAHLVDTPFKFKEPLMRVVQELVYDKLLYWFEAMSLLKEINQVSNSLLLALNWFNSGQHDEIKAFICDARRFIESFAHPIAQSAPHVYISALPFAPDHSLVARHFLPRFPQILAVSIGKSTQWPACIFTSEHHEDSVPSVAFSPNEKYFVSGSHDKTICICDSETGIMTSGPFRCPSAIGSSFFDSDGRRVWARCLDGQVVGWDAQTGGRYLSFEAGQGSGDITGCCCISGSRNIVSVSTGRGTVTLWNTETGTQVRDLLEIPSVDKVSFSPDGCYVAWAGENDTIIRIWNLEDGSEIKHPFPSQLQFSHTERVSALAFSIDGHFAVSGSLDGSILVWDGKTGDIFGRPLSAGKTEVTAVAYSHENKLLVSASGNPGTVMVWDTSTYEAVLGPLEGHTSQITAIALTRDSRRALTASLDGTVRMWDLQRMGIPPVAHTSVGHTDWVERVAFSPCGKRLTSLGEDGTVRVWDTTIRNPLPRPISCPAYSQITFAPDGTKILAFDSDDGTLRVWNADTGELAYCQDLTIDKQYFTQLDHLAFRSTDGRLVVCSRNGIVQLWNLEDDAITKGPYISNPQPSDTSKGIEIIALSPDGLTAAVRDDDRNPRHYMWSTIACEPLPLTFTDSEDIYEVVFSPSGRFFAATSLDGDYLRIWNTQTGELSASSPIRDGMINCLAFSPNDCHIAFSYDISSPTADTSAIWIWDFRSSFETSTAWAGHKAYVTTLAFSPDGEKLASGSGNGQIRIWDTSDLLGCPHPSGGFLGVAQQMRGGWVVDEDGKLLFWVPEENRASLFWPRNIAVTGGDGLLTELDFTRFRYGENWEKCFAGS